MHEKFICGMVEEYYIVYVSTIIATCNIHADS